GRWQPPAGDRYRQGRGRFLKKSIAFSINFSLSAIGPRIGGQFSPPLQTLGELLSTLRRKRGWSQAGLGEKLGMSGAAIARVERGKGGFHPANAAALFDLLVNTAPGLRRSEAEMYLRLTGLDLALADNKRVIPDTPGTLAATIEPGLAGDLQAVHDAIDRFVAGSPSPHAAIGLVQHLLQAAEAWMVQWLPRP